MAYNSSLTLKRGQTGAVLIPVLLFSSILTLGIIILLQSQLLQKKSLADFKFFLKDRKNENQLYHYYQSLSANKLLNDKSIKLIQKFPSNLHYQSTHDDYYFQMHEQKYIYKLNQSQETKNGSDDGEVILPKSTQFNFQNKVIKLITAPGLNQEQLYLYDINNHEILFKAHFEPASSYQLVGNPVNSIYIFDRVGLYKINLNISEQINLKLLKAFDFDGTEDHFDMLITRDARGDGRLIRLLSVNNNKNFFYHEVSEVKDDFLDLFEHYNFS